MSLKFTLFEGQYDVLDSVVSSDTHTSEWPYLQLSKMKLLFKVKMTIYIQMSKRIYWGLFNVWILNEYCNWSKFIITLLMLFTYKVSLWTSLIIIPSPNRGEVKIEKVFVLDFHCFIRKIEDFVGWNMLRSLSLETGDRCSLILWLTKL